MALWIAVALLLAVLLLCACACSLLGKKIPSRGKSGSNQASETIEDEILTLSYREKTVKKGVPLVTALSDLVVGGTGGRLSLAELTLSGEYDPARSGNYEITLSRGDASATVTLFVAEEGVTASACYPTLDECAAEYDLSVDVPSTGRVEILVIPIGFTNKHYDSASELLETAFNGRAEETGWHSLCSYYERSSYGLLSLHATILPTYKTGKSWSAKKKGSPEKEYLAAALDYYDEEIDYSRFDANHDGIIDCVCMVYLAPYDEDSDLWWAYWDTLDEDYETEDEVLTRNYLWLSVDFFSDPLPVEGAINVETLAHEMGHMLGLEDYYDYEEEIYGGLGDSDMMDGTQGDHDPFSKAILGWIRPTVLFRADYDALLSPFEENGEALFIMKEGKESYFQECFVVCYYTPTGLYALRSQEEEGIFSLPGVLIYHVTADLKDPSEMTSLIEIYQTSNGKNPRLIRICEADEDNSIDETGCAEDEDLFQEGATFSPNWNDGTSAGFTLTVSSLSEEGAQVSVLYAAA